jgi:hypothetical protein
MAELAAHLAGPTPAEAVRRPGALRGMPRRHALGDQAVALTGSRQVLFF